MKIKYITNSTNTINTNIGNSMNNGKKLKLLQPSINDKNI
jgi:hypothetical protein